jgi:hypothetical protein
MKDHVDPWNLPESHPDFKGNSEKAEKKQELDFADVINLAIRYYKNEDEAFFDGEEWKKHIPHPRQIPEEIDKLVKQVFVKELKRFV